MACKWIFLSQCFFSHSFLTFNFFFFSIIYLQQHLNFFRVSFWKVLVGIVKPWLSMNHYHVCYLIRCQLSAWSPFYVTLKNRNVIISNMNVRFIKPALARVCYQLLDIPQILLCLSKSIRWHIPHIGLIEARLVYVN